MIFKCTRHSFYAGDHGFLRYTERSTNQYVFDEPGQCCCTISVRDKPAGEPEQVQQYFNFQGYLDDFFIDFHLGYPRFDFQYYWDGSKKLPSLYDPKNKYTNASFRVEDQKNHLKASVYHDGCNKTDCFFGNIYFGNDVDITVLRNNHYRSDVVKLDDLKPDDVWVYDSCWGVESMRVLSDCPETESWRRAKRLIDEVVESVGVYDRYINIGVDEVVVILKADAVLRERLGVIDGFLRGVVENLGGTELFRCCDAVRGETWV